MVLPARRLSKPDEIVQQVRDGTIDMAFIPAAELANLMPEIGALLAPFLADDIAHAGRILHAPAARNLLATLEPRIGAVGVGFGLGGFRQIATRHPVATAADLAGMKMRIPPVLPMLDFYEALGVAPVPVPLQHAYHAFVTGRVDAMDMDAELVIKMNYLDHVAEVIRSNHFMFPLVGLVSAKLWHALEDEERNLIGALMRRHLDSTIDTYLTAEAEYFAQIRAAGKTIRDVGPEFFAEAIASWNEIWAQRSLALHELRRTARDTRVPQSSSNSAR